MTVAASAKGRKAAKAAKEGVKVFAELPQGNRVSGEQLKQQLTTVGSEFEAQFDELEGTLVQRFDVLESKASVVRLNLRPGEPFGNAAP